VSILLVEQKLTIALTIARRVYVMGHGRIVFEGTPAQLAAARSTLTGEHLAAYVGA
jgi:branched-chain amino acid transport system ATP-binding protein